MPSIWRTNVEITVCAPNYVLIFAGLKLHRTVGALIRTHFSGLVARLQTVISSEIKIKPGLVIQYWGADSYANADANLWLFGRSFIYCGFCLDYDLIFITVNTKCLN